MLAKNLHLLLCYHATERYVQMEKMHVEIYSVHIAYLKHKLLHNFLLNLILLLIQVLSKILPLPIVHLRQMALLEEGI